MRTKSGITLSKNKQSFLNKPSESKIIRSCEVDSIAQHYKEKYGIAILKNGGSILGQALIKNGQNNLRENFKKTTEELQNEATKYDGFIKSMQFSFDFCFESEISLLCKNLLAAYCREDNRALRTDLTSAELQEIKTILTSNSQIKTVMDERLDNIIQKRMQKEVDVTDYCLTSDEVRQEIAFVQQSLQDGQVAGYMFTNGRAMSSQHFEVILISKNWIIKPVSWYQSIDAERKLRQEVHAVQGIHWSELKLDSPKLIKKTENIEFPEAQKDNHGCATLGLLYLKELLKNDCHQLKEYTLSFPLDKDTWIFFPSPHVLRYSQSSTYNTLICSMLMDSDEMEPFPIRSSVVVYDDEMNPIRIKISTNPDQTLFVSTLQKLLQDGIKSAEIEQNLAHIEHNRALLSKLPEFREKWMAAFHQMMEKRNTMNSGYNRYLAYSSHRLFKIQDDKSSSHHKVLEKTLNTAT